MESRPNVSADCPIVVGGCIRSGTSLVRRILDAHPNIHCGPEVKFFQDFFGHYIGDPLRKIRFVNTARAIVPEDFLFEKLGAVFIEMHEFAAALVGKPRWADKNPENPLYLRQWQQLLGDNWLFLHVMRNPLDTIASIAEEDWGDTPRSLWGRIGLYLEHIQAALDFERENPGRYHRIIYEELVTQPRKVLLELMAWLGETYDDSLLAFNDVEHQDGLEDHKVKTTAAIHSDSIGRWKADLSPDEAYEIIGSCLPLWSEVDPDRKWLRFIGVGLEAETATAGFRPSAPGIRRRLATAEFLLPVKVAAGLEPEAEWKPVPVNIDTGRINMRGETRPASEDSLFPITIQPPLGAWQYGLELPVAFADDGSYVVRLRCRLDCGKAGFAVLNAAEDDFSYRIFVENEPGDLLVNLPVFEPANTGRIVIETAEKEEPVKVTLLGVELLAAGIQLTGVSPR